MKDQIRNRVHEAVIRVAAEQGGFSSNKIQSGSDVVSDLNLDSLDMVEIVIAVEENFEVSIPDDILNRELDISTKTVTIDTICEVLSSYIISQKVPAIDE